LIFGEGGARAISYCWRDASALLTPYVVAVLAVESNRRLFETVRRKAPERAVAQAAERGRTQGRRGAYL